MSSSPTAPTPTTAPVATPAASPVEPELNPFLAPRAPQNTPAPTGRVTLLRILAIFLLLGAFDRGLATGTMRTIAPEEAGQLFMIVAIAGIASTIVGFLLAYATGARATAIAGCVLAAIGCALMSFGSIFGLTAPCILRAAGLGFVSTVLPVLLGRARFAGPNARDGAFTLVAVTREVSSLAAMPAMAIASLGGGLIIQIPAAFAATAAAALAFGMPRTLEHERTITEPDPHDAPPPAGRERWLALAAALLISTTISLARRASSSDPSTSAQMEWMLAGSLISIMLGAILAWSAYASPERDRGWNKIAIGALAATGSAVAMAMITPGSGASAVLTRIALAGECAAGVLSFPILSGIAATMSSERRALTATAILTLSINVGSAASRVIPETILAPAGFGVGIATLVLAAMARKHARAHRS